MRYLGKEEYHLWNNIQLHIMKSSVIMNDLNFDKVFKWQIDNDNLFQSFGPALLNALSP